MRKEASLMRPNTGVEGEQRPHTALPGTGHPLLPWGAQHRERGCPWGGGT